MKKLILLSILVCSTSVYAQKKNLSALSEKQEKRTIEIVNTWIKEIFKGEKVDKLMKISDVPFAYDRKKIIYNKSDLRKHYLDIFNEKGKRSVPDFETKIIEFKSEILNNSIPLNFVRVVVIIHKEDYTEGAEICVSIKENEYKIVGFSD